MAARARGRSLSALIKLAIALLSDVTALEELEILQVRRRAREGAAHFYTLVFPLLKKRGWGISMRYNIAEDHTV